MGTALRAIRPCDRAPAREPDLPIFHLGCGLARTKGQLIAFRFLFGTGRLGAPRDRRRRPERSLHGREPRQGAVHLQSRAAPRAGHRAHRRRLHRAEHDPGAGPSTPPPSPTP